MPIAGLKINKSPTSSESELSKEEQLSVEVVAPSPVDMLLPGAAMLNYRTADQYPTTISSFPSNAIIGMFQINN
jgi:hypothetical protein